MAETKLNLITDRTQEDVSILQALRSKPLSQWTEEELAWFNQAKSKGAYDYTDLNRVGGAMAYLVSKFGEYGYIVSINPKTDWAKEDAQTESQMTQYLADLQKLRDTLSVLKGTPEVPPTMKKLTLQAANNIEKILENIDILLTRIPDNFRRCGQFTFWSGTQPLPAAKSDLGRTWAELDAMNTTWRNWQVTSWYLLLYGNLEAEGDVA